MKRLPFYILLFVFISSCGIGGIRLHLKNPKKPGRYPKLTEEVRLIGQLTKYRTCFDVKRYTLDIRFDEKRKNINGIVGISAVAIQDIDTLQLDLYKNLIIKHTEVWYEGDAEMVPAVIRKENALFLAMPKKIYGGTKFIIVISYEGSPIIAKKPPWDGGFVWKKDKNGNTWAGVACQSEGASLWWPNKDHNSDEADSTSISLTVKSPLVAVANGQFQDSIYNHKDSTITYKWLASYPVNNYDITFYIGDFVKIEDSFKSITGNTVPISHYVLSYNYDKAIKHFPQAKDHIAFYEKTFGPYPWQRDGFRLVESPYAGMEHQSAIAYGNGYKNDFKEFDYIILHETAHEWWGNSVTAADLADGWLHEGFATYSEALYREHISGFSEYINHLYMYRFTIKNKLPVVRARERRFFDYHDEDIYTKGAWVLHSLRTLLNNDTLFFGILKTFYSQNAMKQVLTEDFEEVVKTKTGKDYSWFFQQYLYDRRSPMLEYQFVKEGMLCRWADAVPGFEMPCEIAVYGSMTRIVPGTKVRLFPVYKENTNVKSAILKTLCGVRENKKLKKLIKSGNNFTSDNTEFKVKLTLNGSKTDTWKLIIETK